MVKILLNNGISIEKIELTIIKVTPVTSKCKVKYWLIDLARYAFIITKNKNDSKIPVLE